MSHDPVPPPHRAPDAARRRAAFPRTLRVCTAVYLLLGTACALFLGSCCATNRLWRAVDDAPQRVVAATIDDAGTLHAALEHARGGTFVVQAELGEPTPEWRTVAARRTGAYAGRLPATTVPIDVHAERPIGWNHVTLRWMHHVAPTSAESNSLWVEGAGYHVVVECPSRVDWGTTAPYFAVLLTPLTVVVDIVSSPVHVAWVFATAGGHGDPWLPWCGGP